MCVWCGLWAWTWAHRPGPGRALTPCRALFQKHVAMLLGVVGTDVPLRDIQKHAPPFKVGNATSQPPPPSAISWAN